MKNKRFDITILLLALLLALAMLMTLCHGREGDSRHGYGILPQPGAEVLV